MAETYTIKMATVADADAISSFQIAMAWETEKLKLDPREVRQGVNTIFTESSRGFYLIAHWRKSIPIGCALILFEWSDWRNADVWWIHSVYVLPEHRGKGVFRAIFHHIEHLAHASGARGLRLYVAKTNSDAKSVYTKLNMNSDHYDLFEKMFDN